MAWIGRPLIWREGQIGTLASRSLEAGAMIDTLLARRYVDLGGATAWGQFIDDSHHSTDQWGLFGTTAAVQTLALRASPADANRHIRDAMLLIPTSRDEYDPRLEPKVRKGDFQNIIRLAFIAEALFPGRKEIARDVRPEIVGDIFSLAQGDPHWNPMSAVEGAARAEGDAFVTAYVLVALRRYEDPIGELRPYRIWLANQFSTYSWIRARPDLSALIGLALLPRERDPQNPEVVADTLKSCESTLTKWCREEPIVLDRPLFHGFNFGRWTDYMFLHPELVAALFFLRSNNPPRARRYVAEVVTALVENIDRFGYFQGRPGMGATVDQMWASRLLDSFYQTYVDKSRRPILLPRFIATRRLRWIVLVAAVVGFAVVAAATSSPQAGAIGAAAGVVIGATIGVLVSWAFERD